MSAEGKNENSLNETAGQPDIVVQDVCFGYGARHEVLHDACFEIAPRSFVAVVGPNGGGKTTLMRLLLGELRPRFGSIKVLGMDPADAARMVGYTPQRVHFDPSFPVSVLDAVLIGCSACRMLGLFSRAERRAALEALERVGMAEFARRPLSSLSGGQLQRVLIAQAIMPRPRMLFLDEPTANVDAEAEQRIYRLLRELNETMTIVMVSHNLSVVTAKATHVLCVSHTVDMHRIEEVADGIVGGAGGVAFTRLHHGAECQVSHPHEPDDHEHHDTPDCHCADCAHGRAGACAGKDGGHA